MESIIAFLARYYAIVAFEYDTLDVFNIKDVSLDRTRIKPAFFGIQLNIRTF